MDYKNALNPLVPSTILKILWKRDTEEALIGAKFPQFYRQILRQKRKHLAKNMEFCQVFLIFFAVGRI
jgi:16S rRNA A1518/A1519 N6-dimethyltransferase RsmA/KsgA/DIM1 with predicted DNA glycosylase/AP lyase activity